MHRCTARRRAACTDDVLGLGGAPVASLCCCCCCPRVSLHFSVLAQRGVNECARDPVLRREKINRAGRNKFSLLMAANCIMYMRARVPYIGALVRVAGRLGKLFFFCLGHCLFIGRRSSACVPPPPPSPALGTRGDSLCPAALSDSWTGSSATSCRLFLCCCSPALYSLFPIRARIKRGSEKRPRYCCVTEFRRRKTFARCIGARRCWAGFGGGI